MTNFDFLKSDAQFEPFADAAIAAERVFHIDAATSAVSCRRAMEFAVKWMYSVDSSLVMPYQDKLVSLINSDEFRGIVGADIFKRLEYIRLLGNSASHNPRNITGDQAALALENLFVFMNYIAYCYGGDYTESEFDITLAQRGDEKAGAHITELDFQKLLEENERLKAELTKRREGRRESYISSPLDLSEARTRKAYIDVMLTSAGWERGRDWFDEYYIENMPNKSGEGYADYVLMGDDGRPLAVIEAKRTGTDAAVGRQQAKLYADDLEQRFGRRPVIFLSNGFDTRIWIDQPNGYPERPVSGIYSKNDLEKEFSKIRAKTNLKGAEIDESITNRPYQKEAITAVCEAFGERNRRKALLVMATGSGKTRTVISLTDVLMRHGWIKNFLFLADRSSLVIQAKRAFGALMPNLSVTNLISDRDNYNARGVFSTYQTMINKIDSSEDSDGARIYTPGHFDLIILDEAHRSIYNKYKDIFMYFDSLLIGLTATPKDEIDKNTYEIFELEAGVPTYGYELRQAVQDGFLVDYRSIETTLKFMQSGIVYEDLSEEEKNEYEETFADESGYIPETIESGALNRWVFNIDTIRQVLNTLMTKGLKVDYGSRIGKTIIFAKNHAHAEKIQEVWNREYPHYPPNYCRVIDNYTNYAQSLIDEFSISDRMPQIAISVDMMDTGIDVPEVLNLVFFKKVMSRAKFWQMIGRGTRLCEGLIDGEDKKEFYIFDFCSNFEFFRINNGRGGAVGTLMTVQEQLFNIRMALVFKLQGTATMTDELGDFRARLVKELTDRVCALDRDNFAVRLHIQHVDRFSSKEAYQLLDYEDTLIAAEHVAPLINPEADEFTALRFDILMHTIELLALIQKSSKKASGDLVKKARALSGLMHIEEIAAQRELIEAVLSADYFESAGIREFEEVRERLRGLMKYVEREQSARYETNFADSIVKIEENPADYGDDTLKDYRLKANHYIRMNENNRAIAKLRTNQPLSPADVDELERILWSEAGTKDDYLREYGEMPLGELVRSVTGLDKQAANEAFSEFLSEVKLDSRQIYFVGQIINYIIKNGMMKDLSVLQSSPFTDRGYISEVFADLSLWDNIRRRIQQVNANASEDFRR